MPVPFRKSGQTLMLVAVIFAFRYGLNRGVYCNLYASKRWNILWQYTFAILDTDEHPHFQHVKGKDRTHAPTGCRMSDVGCRLSDVGCGSFRCQMSDRISDFHNFVVGFSTTRIGWHPQASKVHWVPPLNRQLYSGEPVCIYQGYLNKPE